MLKEGRERETKRRSKVKLRHPVCFPEEKQVPDPPPDSNARQIDAPERLELRFLTLTDACETTKPVKNQETPPFPPHTTTTPVH